MKHEKQWYTCDRCGKEIKETPSNAIWKRSFYRKIYTNAELKILTANRMGDISQCDLISPEVSSVEITESYATKTRTLHLCGECRKEFESFLKNEH